MARDVRQHRIAAGRAGFRSYGGCSSVGRARYEMCFEERHKQQFRLCLVKKHEQQFFFVFRTPWSQVRVLPPAFPGERSNSRDPLSPERDRIFLHAPGSRPGCMADIAQMVRAGAQFRILRAGGGSSPPVCLPGRHPARLLSPFLDGPYFHSRSGRQQLPGVHEGELRASTGDQHHAGKRGRHPFSFLTRTSGFRKGTAGRGEGKRCKGQARCRAAKALHNMARHGKGKV